MKRGAPPPVIDPKVAAHLVRSVDNALVHLRIIRLALSDVARHGAKVEDLSGEKKDGTEDHGETE